MAQLERHIPRRRHIAEHHPHTYGTQKSTKEYRLLDPIGNRQTSPISASQTGPRTGALRNKQKWQLPG